jgi:hypothetical protein
MVEKKVKKVKLVVSMCDKSLYVNLAHGRAVKIRARGTAEVEEADLQSPEIIFHKNRGNVVVLDKPKEMVEHVKAEPEKESKPEVDKSEKAEPTKEAKSKVGESVKAEAEKKAKREVPESEKVEPEKEVKSANKVK